MNRSYNNSPITQIHILDFKRVRQICNRRHRGKEESSEYRNLKEAPWCIFPKGSFTIEASIVLPVVICVFICIMYFFRVIEIQTGMQKSLDETSRLMAVVTGTEENDNDAGLTASILLAHAKVSKYKVPTNYVLGGRIGISFLNSSDDGEFLDLNTTCYVPCPIRMFGFKGTTVNNRAKVRKWVGCKRDILNDDKEETIVFVAETGEVYHMTMYCTYLDPSARVVLSTEIDEIRNKSGAKYRSCSKCGGVSNMYFVTNYGTVYHSTLACSSIKRTINRMSLEEAKKQYRGCSKCASQ